MSEYFWQSWDCSNCGTRNTGCRDDIEKCTSCGATRKTRYLNWKIAPLKPTTNQADINFINGKPRWECPSCGSFPAGSLSVCPNCGDSKDGAREVKTYTFDEDNLPSYAADSPVEFEDHHFSHDGESDWNASDYDSTITLSDLLDEKPKRDEHEYTDFVNDSKRKRSPDAQNIAWKLAVAMVVFGLIGIGVWVKSKLDERHTETVSIDTHTWSRDINIQQYRWVRENNTTGYPAGSRDKSRNWEVIGHHYETRCCKTEYYTERVADGQDCRTVYSDTGTGGVRSSQECSTRYTTVSRSRQVNYQERVDDYGYRYYFEIQRWVHNRTIHSGDTDWGPAHWNEDFTLIPDDPTRDDDEYEQESGRTQNYCVTFTYLEDITKSECTANENEWLTWRQGFEVTYNGFNQIVGDPVPLSTR